MGNLSICRLLVTEYSIDLLKQDGDGNTALHLAMRKQDFKINKLLILTAREDGLENEVLQQTNKEGQTPMGMCDSQVFL